MEGTLILAVSEREYSGYSTKDERNLKIYILELQYSLSFATKRFGWR